MKDNQNTITSPLYSKAKLADAEALDFIKSLPQTFADAEKLLSSNHVEINDNVLENRIKLETFIRKFHSEADTLNDSVVKQWVLLNDL